jgi:hypothetical protein
LYVSLTAILPCCLAYILRTDYVGIHITGRLDIGIGNGNQGGQMKYDIHMSSNFKAVMWVPDIPAQYLNIWRDIEIRERGEYYHRNGGLPRRLLKRVLEITRRGTAPLS